MMEIGVGTQLVDRLGNVRTIERMESREPEPISVQRIYIERSGAGLQVQIFTSDDQKWHVVFHDKRDVDRITLYDVCLHGGVLLEDFHGQEV